MDEITRKVGAVTVAGMFLATEALSPLAEYRWRHDAITARDPAQFDLPRWNTELPDDSPEGGHSPVPPVLRVATMYSTSSDSIHTLRIDLPPRG
jgi:hypothetical protein